MADDGDHKSISNMEIYEHWLKFKHLGRKSCCNNIEKRLKINSNRKTYEKVIKILKNLEKRWKASQCTKSIMLKHHHFFGNLKYDCKNLMCFVLFTFLFEIELRFFIGKLLIFIKFVFYPFSIIYSS